jgi:methionine-rich copper-binding protein CopC
MVYAKWNGDLAAEDPRRRNIIMKTVRSVFLAGLAFLSMSGAAWAHAHLETSVPANGSTVAKAPTEIVLTFSDAARVTAVAITKDGGQEQKIAKLPTELATRIAVAIPKLADGSYTVDWRVASKDGHVMNGKVRFTIGGTPKPAAASPTGHEGHGGH